ncbi:hypothetical protein RFI_16852, partial [Reticulomyxa filosa]
MLPSPPAANRERRVSKQERRRNNSTAGTEEGKATPKGNGERKQEKEKESDPVEDLLAFFADTTVGNDNEKEMKTETTKATTMATLIALPPISSGNRQSKESMEEKRWKGNLFNEEKEKDNKVSGKKAQISKVDEEEEEAEPEGVIEIDDESTDLTEKTSDKRKEVPKSQMYSEGTIKSDWENDQSNTNNNSDAIDNESNLYVNGIEELHKGAVMLKWPRRHGFPHFKYVELSQDNLRIQWYSKNKSLKETNVHMKHIVSIVRGQTTEAFLKKPRKNLESGSFSILYLCSPKKGAPESLDLVAQSKIQCEIWVRSLIKLKQLWQTHYQSNDEFNDDNEFCDYSSFQKLTFLNVGIKKSELPVSISTQFHNDVNKSSNNSNQQNHSDMLEITQLETLQNEYNAMAKTYAALADIIKQNNSLFQ